MKVLICGDRNWSNYDLVLAELRKLTDVKLVIEGGCRGADAHGHAAADTLGIPTSVFPAKWETYGRAAGPIRNAQMLKEGKPDLVLAFHNNIKQSKGTANMVKLTQQANVTVRIIKEHD